MQVKTLKKSLVVPAALAAFFVSPNNAAAHRVPPSSPYSCNHPPRRWSVREVQCVVRKVFQGPYLWKAMRVVSCESGFNTREISPTDDYSVFQINRPSHPDYFRGWWRWRHRFDPVYNSRYAFRMSSGGANFSAWACNGWAP